MDKKEMPKIFTTKEIESFIRVHFQSKIDHNELEAIGFDMKNTNNLDKQYVFYKRTLFEGICNGILMCGGKIEVIDDESLENLKIGDDVLVYDKNGLFEAIFYVERMTDNYLVIGGAKFSKAHGWMCCNHNMFAKLASEEDIERVENKKKRIF